MSLSHAQIQSFIATQADYVYNPVKWAFEQLKVDLDNWQRAAAMGVVSKKYAAWSAGSGVGKSCLLAILILYFLSTRPFPKIPATAPTQHQLQDVLWAEISKWLRRNELLSRMFKWTATRVSLRGHEAEWYAVARTATPRPGGTAAEGLQGFHEGNIMFIVDEASGVPEQVMAAVDGALTTPGAHVILASNPTRRSGYFYRIISDETEKEHWDVHFINAENAAFVDPAAITRVARMYGKNSDYYRVKVLGLPPMADATSLITPEQIFNMHTRSLDDLADHSCVVSCDPARFGDDDTVFYVRKGKRFLERVFVHGMDTTQIVKILLDLIHSYRATTANIDEIGIVAGVVDQAKQLLRAEQQSRRLAQVCRVVGIHVGQTASQPDQFYNLRAELFWNLRHVVDDICVPFETPQLDEELLTITYGWDQKDTRIKIQSKDDIRKVLKRSPGDADALVLNLHGLLTNIANAYASPLYAGVGVRDRDLINYQNQHKQEQLALTFASIGKRRGDADAVGVQRYGHIDRLGLRLS